MKKTRHRLISTFSLWMLAVSVTLLQAQSHTVPADKGLAPEWLQSLYERGEKEMYAGDDLNTIGMPVCGIGTGQLYLSGDGTLGCWELFNSHFFIGTGKGAYDQYRTPTHPVEHGLSVLLKKNGEWEAKPLSKEGFEKVSFCGEYPIGAVTYGEEDFPLEVALEVFSPFIPLNAKDSALPATLLHVSLRNESESPEETRLLTWIENPVCIHSAQQEEGFRKTERIRNRRYASLLHSAFPPPPEKEENQPRPVLLIEDFEGDTYEKWEVSGRAFGQGPASGTLQGQQTVSGFMGKGLVNTFLEGDTTEGTILSQPFTIQRKRINFLLGGGAHPDQTCIQLLVDGEVVRSAHGENKERLQWTSWNVAPLQGKKAQIQIVDNHTGGWGHINVDQIEQADLSRHGSPRSLQHLGDFGTLTYTLLGQSASEDESSQLLEALGLSYDTAKEAVFPLMERHSSALLSKSVTIKPGERHTYICLLTWHFPNHVHGHEYAARFEDAAEVRDYVIKNYARLAGDTRKWRDLYYDSTLPYWLLDRLHSTVSTLSTGTAQWWKNGRFWAFEGVVCCAGTCTHVWNYAHSHARLFPTLARSVREMQDLDSEQGGFHENGLIGFRSNDAYAADGQNGSVLKAYREHLISPDDAFLKRNWPRIKKALLFSMEQDGDRDGLIENSQHNTYDINFEGPNTMVGSLYLAALRAGEEMAKAMDDATFAEECRSIFESGSKKTMERLWDGEYFIQQVDLERHPKHQYARGCLSDQLFGQGWAHQLGLGYILPEDQVKKALSSVWKYNWAPDVGPHNELHPPLRVFAMPGEPGLFTCTWPKTDHLDQGVMYKNEVWTGIEYQVAGHMVREGMTDEGVSIVKGIHERYHPSSNNPYNEIECGDHYARGLASWGVYLALMGFQYDGPKGALTFCPRITPDSFRSAFTTAQAWGSFTQQVADGIQENRIDVRHGELRLTSLTLTPHMRKRPEQVIVRKGRSKVKVGSPLGQGQLQILFPKELKLREGQVLTVEMR